MGNSPISGNMGKSVQGNVDPASAPAHSSSQSGLVAQAPATCSTPQVRDDISGFDDMVADTEIQVPGILPQQQHHTGTLGQNLHQPLKSSGQNVPTSVATPSSAAPQVVMLPDKKDPLPDNLSLEDICKTYPNHVTNRDVLLRFITEKPILNTSQLARWIWDRYPSAKRDQYKDGRGWNGLEQHIRKLKKEIRGRAMVAANNSVSVPRQDTQTGSHIQNPQAPSNASGVGGDVATWEKDREVMLNGLLSGEFRLQQGLINGLLGLRHSDWHSKSPQEKWNLGMEEWMSRVKRQEAHIAARYQINTDTLNIPQAEPAHMHLRLREIIRMGRSGELLDALEFTVGIVENLTRAWTGEYWDLHDGRAV